MADVNRNVTINVAVKYAQSGAAPRSTFQPQGSFGPSVSSGGDVEKQARASRKAMDDTVAHARRTGPLVEEALNNPLIKAIKNEKLRMEAARETARLIAADRLKEIQIEEKLAAFRRQKATEAIKAEQQVSLAMTRAMSSTRALGESTLLAVRGFVMLGVTGQKEVQKVLNTLLVAQGAIDVYKGLSGILVGIAGAYRQVAAAAAAAATAQAASAAAGKAGAVAGGAGMAGGVAGAGGLGGLAATGVGLPIAVGAGISFGLYQLITRNAQQNINRQEFERGNRRVEMDFAAQTERTRLGADFQNSMTRFDASRGISDLRARTDLNESQGLMSDASGMAGRARTTAERQSANRSIMQARQSFMQSLAGADERTGGFLGRARASVDASQGRINELHRTATTRSSEEQLTALQAATQQKVTAENSVLEIIRKQVELRERAMSFQRESVQIARDQLQAEKDRLGAINQGLGSLNVGEQDEVRRIAKKVKGGGTVSEEELRFLEGRGGGAFNEFTGQQRRRIGEAAFAGDDLSAITGGGSQIRELEAALKSLTTTATGGSSLLETFEKINQKRADEAAALKKLADDSESLTNISASIEILHRNVKSLEDLMTRRKAYEEG